jgi:hypothetical protein
MAASHLAFDNRGRAATKYGSRGRRECDVKGVAHRLEDESIMSLNSVSYQLIVVRELWT